MFGERPSGETTLEENLVNHLMQGIQPCTVLEVFPVAHHLQMCAWEAAENPDKVPAPIACSHTSDRYAVIFRHGQRFQWMARRQGPAALEKIPVLIRFAPVTYAIKMAQFIVFIVFIST